MNRAIDYRKYRGKGRPRQSDYKLACKTHENDDNDLTLFVAVLLVALIVAASLVAIIANFSGLTDAFINSFA